MPKFTDEQEKYIQDQVNKYMEDTAVQREIEARIKEEEEKIERQRRWGG